jgi:alpha-L-rhamnosidase
MKLFKTILCSVLFYTCCTLAIAQVNTNNLRCELLHDPLGIDVTAPRLSWEINSTQRNVMQQAYQVIVASSLQKLNADNGDLWNSGKTNSNTSIQVPYKGSQLNSRMTCYWKVKVWTTKGNSQWSAPALWTMGLFQPKDWTAKWIGMDRAFAWDSVSKFSRLSARYLRKQFTAAAAVKRATVYVSGVGLYELYINGKKTGDQVLSPAPTDYRKAVLYNTYDVTKQLQQGNNAIGVVLGNGRFFTMRQNYKPKKIATFGFPKLLLQLEVEYANGSKQIINSDETWKLTADGPIRTNNEYDGEEYDATKELKGWAVAGYNDQSWLAAQLVGQPGGVLTAAMQEPMKIMRVIKPVSVKAIAGGKYILDMGQNMAGWLQLKAKGRKGDTITLRFAESLQADGQLYTANLRDAQVTDKYILRGEGTETWHPSFVFHGFRYVEISGYTGTPSLASFEGHLVYDALANTGTFTSSDTVLNRIHQNAWWGIASNYKGMPIDCPQRNERQPWLGDRTIGALGESYLFGNAKLYAKWLNDIEQSQTAEGVIPDVAPAFWNYYTDDVTWPAAYITVADMLYTQYGDLRAIELHYPSMKKWLWHMRDSYLKDGLMTKDKYGDWCVPPESLELIHAKDSSRNTSGVLIATAYYYRLLQYMAKFAALTNRPADAVEYNTLAVTINKSFQAKFYNQQKKYYGNNTVTANLLPLYFGMVPDSLREPVFNNIVTKTLVENHGHISTGLIGTQFLMRGLSAHARSEIAYQLAATTTYPGWGYMVKNGATTIWELWNGNTANPQMNSQNHVMLLGDLLSWLYGNLAGIRSDDTTTAFKKIIMAPTPMEGLTSVTASYRSVHGLIKSAWKNSTQQFEWQVTVPANTIAQITLPVPTGSIVAESGNPIAGIIGIRYLETNGNQQVYEIGSGTYTFVVKYAFKNGIVKEQVIFKEAAFPESHAATIAETPAGLIAAWFGGTKERNPDVEIYISRLIKGEWTAPVSVANGIISDTQRVACWNPVLYQVPGGELLLFYKTGVNVAAWKGWLIRSNNNGLTWSKPQALPDGFIGPVKNKPVMIGKELFCASSTEGSGWKVHFEVTADTGRTWRKIGPINDGKTYNTIQPSILTYPGGKLQILCRSKERVVAASWSADGGKTWSAFEPSGLPNNNSGTDAVTLQDGRQLIVYNPVKPAASLKNGKGARTPLNVAITKDGKTWDAALVLEDSPVSQYSYPSVIQSKDGMVHIVYTWRREKIKYVQVDPSKLQLQPISNEQWPGAQTAAADQHTEDL